MTFECFVDKYFDEKTTAIINKKRNKTIQFLNAYCDVENDGSIVTKENGSYIENAALVVCEIIDDKPSFIDFLSDHGLTEILAFRHFRKTMRYNRVACCGFSKKEQKWYGWTHRGIRCFGIGDVYFNYLSGKPARTLDDCKKLAFYAVQELN